MQRPILLVNNRRPMVFTTEGEIQTDVLAWLSKAAAHRNLWFKRVPLGPVIHPKGWGKNPLAGMPDIIGIYEGTFFGLELKKAKGTAQENQIKTMAAINQAGGNAQIVRSVEDVERMFRAMGYGKAE